ncbi:hypothetical protein SLS60_005477 [Paraconiothyrium brasiliense]|uniref:Uncharacterized protein n=1 Tax=Paraconiothyrium brasiliense TaxID=300254 RepID=A0ABR3RHH7_9PLEO
MAEAITLRNQLESSFLRLPGEIRNKIYTYTFPGTVLSVVPYSGKLEDRSKGSYYLLFTCRQILAEAKKLCMGNVVLELPPLKHTFAFRRTVSLSTMESLRRVRVSRKLAQFMMCGKDHANTMQVIGSRLTSLEVVEVCHKHTRAGYGRALLNHRLRRATGNQILEVDFVCAALGVVSA